MQGPLERMDNSPGLLAAVGAAVLVIVALAVFAFGSVLSGDGDETSAGEGADQSADGSASDGTGDDAGTNDGDGGSDDGIGGSAGGGQDNDSDDADQDSGSGSDEGTTTTTEDDSSTTTESEDSDSDFCEAGTRNNFDIRFASGAVSAEESNTVPADEVDLYQLQVNRGQILTATVRADAATLSVQIKTPGGRVIPVTGDLFSETIAPTEAGAYQICFDPLGRDVAYVLTVDVITDNTPTKISAPWCGDSVNDRGEIRFTTGSISGQVQQSVIRGERDLYRLEAAQGQDIDLLMTSLEDNATFSFRTPSGEVVIRDVSDFRFPLPESGDYLICVGSTRGNASYQLTVTIE